NCAGVPVDDSVAAILRATWPLLPIPLTMTRPFTAASRSMARVNAPSSCPESWASASPANASTRRATARSLEAAALGRRGSTLIMRAQVFLPGPTLARAKAAGASENHAKKRFVDYGQPARVDQAGPNT